MILNLNFANNAILLCFFFFFLIIDLYFLIPAVVTQIFNPIAEVVFPIGIPIKEAKAETEVHAVILEAKIRKCSQFTLCYSQFILLYFFKKRISCFILIF